MITLAFDTETTGMLQKGLPLDHPSQPRICQIGMLLRENKKVVGEVNVLITPDNWSIPAGATAVHGITDEMCFLMGVPLLTALSMFQNMVKVSDVIIAHNIQYDLDVIGGEFKRKERAMAQKETSEGYFCTMQHMTDVCKLPGRFGKHKWPTLTETYQHCFNEKFEGAHDAMADVRACARIFDWIQEQPK